ncbi:MAG: hypothetical protein NT003_01065 [Candidatus Magasanikbacteria bacterium]|nr:hypothetical protein [Candidatus Magasanikbacteria bacterium]
MNQSLNLSQVACSILGCPSDPRPLHECGIPSLRWLADKYNGSAITVHDLVENAVCPRHGDFLADWAGMPIVEMAVVMQDMLFHNATTTVERALTQNAAPQQMQPSSQVAPAPAAAPTKASESPKPLAWNMPQSVAATKAAQQPQAPAPVPAPKPTRTEPFALPGQLQHQVVPPVSATTPVVEGDDDVEIDNDGDDTAADNNKGSLTLLRFTPSETASRGGVGQGLSGGKEGKTKRQMRQERAAERADKVLRQGSGK